MIHTGQTYTNREYTRRAQVDSAEITVFEISTGRIMATYERTTDMTPGTVWDLVRQTPELADRVDVSSLPESAREHLQPTTVVIGKETHLVPAGLVMEIKVTKSLAGTLRRNGEAGSSARKVRNLRELIERSMQVETNTARQIMRWFW